ncbi:hypothetical protein GIB67_010086 [Kingdonia uniflora]|uniref:No apical meristem-associated C-terminal domain-containing protein n=1 Tax=Kingdonia uniflora TaxID=39325 RepID=A0A7J7PAJ9_9MAGN|nr:hypothetical protein GIB67_010086 [Kingdonia uniflora]
MPKTEDEILNTVLGVRFGYSKGLGHGVLPQSSKRVLSIQLEEEVQRRRDGEEFQRRRAEKAEKSNEELKAEMVSQRKKNRGDGCSSREVRGLDAAIQCLIFMIYLVHGESTQHSQSDANALIPVEAAAPQKEKGKGIKKRAPAKQRPSVQVPEDAKFLDETDDARMHWTDADFTYLARVWENNAHKIYKGLNSGNDFKHREAYKILAREPRWANLRDNGLNHAVNIPRNVARKTSNNFSLGNLVGSNNLLEDPDNPPTPQSTGQNSVLDVLLNEGGSRPIGQKLYRKNIVLQKVMKGVTTSGSSVHALLDELRLKKIQAKEEKERRRVEVMQCW